MSTSPSWLPELILLENFPDWKSYLDALYEAFKKDFIDNKPKYNGNELAIKRHPLLNEKEATFWHIVSDGKIEDEKIPEIRRCERIKWPKPLIENCSDSKIKCWSNQRKGEKRILIWFEEIDYLVVLADRNSYILFWTAYPIKYNHYRRKLKNEYEAYIKANAAQ